MNDGPVSRHPFKQTYEALTRPERSRYHEAVWAFERQLHRALTEPELIHVVQMVKSGGEPTVEILKSL